MLGPLIGWSVLPPPVCVTFRNPAERMAYVQSVGRDEVRQKAERAWDATKREYDDGQRLGRAS